MNNIGAVSPETRPRARMRPVMMFGIAIGMITCQIVCNLVAPKARLFSLKLSGIAFKASSVVRIMRGTHNKPKVREPAKILSPKSRYLTKRVIPKSPKTIEGMPLRLLVITRMNRINFLFGAYSFMYIPLIIPVGKANIALPIIR